MTKARTNGAPSGSGSVIAAIYALLEPFNRNRVDLTAATDISADLNVDSVAVLEHGVELGGRTWTTFLSELEWTPSSLEATICHQVGSAHQSRILESLGLNKENDFCTYPYLGNMGTAALPVAAAIAEDRGFLTPGMTVGFLGIGSGLNCMMLGWQW